MGKESNESTVTTPSGGDLSPQSSNEVAEVEKRTFWQRVKEPGSVWQIVIAALLAIAIGLAVTFTVDEVPDAAIAILAIPGDLWLRALKAVGECFHSFKDVAQEHY